MISARLRFKQIAAPPCISGGRGEVKNPPHCWIYFTSYDRKPIRTYSEFELCFNCSSFLHLMLRPFSLIGTSLLLKSVQYEIARSQEQKCPSTISVSIYLRPRIFIRVHYMHIWEPNSMQSAIITLLFNQFIHTNRT